MSRDADIPTDFTVYDGRHHVLGASMLAAADAALRALFEEGVETPFAVKRAKFTRKTGCNGRLYLVEGRAPPVDDENSAASIVGRLGDRPVAASFIPDPGAPVDRDRPSANVIADVEPQGDFGGRCHIRTDGLEPTLRCLVDANKHVQLAGPGVRGFAGERKPITELVYIEGLAIDPALRRLDTDLQVEPMGSRSDSGRLFTLNRLRFHASDGGERRLTMAFSFALPEEDRA